MRIFPVAACLIAMACLDSGVWAMPAVNNMWDLRMSQPNQSPVNDVEWTDLSMARGMSMGASPCTCEGKVCGCCQSVKIPELGINTKACANVTFLSSQIGASFTLTFDGKVVLQKTVSVKNPDPVCVKFANKFGAEICGELYKLSVSPSDFEGCARLEGKLLGKTVATVDLGCFKMSFKTVAQDQSSVNDVEWTDLSMARGMSMGASPCTCEGKVCGCCQPVKIPELGINTKACANVTFLSSQIGASFTLSFDGKVIFKKTVSVKNPDPVCVKFSNKFGAEICGELYKLSVSPSDFEGCARLEGKLFGKTVATIDLGCFKMSFKTVAQVPLSLASKSIAEWTDVAPMAPADNGDCSCSAEQCQCCQHIQIKELKLDNDVCVQVEFLSTSLGVTVSLTIDGKVIFKKTLSVQDPSPLCLPFAGGKLCVELYNLALTPTDFSGCSRLEAEFFGRVVAKVDLGCFRIPLRLAANEQIKEIALSRGRMSQMSLKEAMVGQPAAQVSQPQAGHAPASLPMTILLDRDMSNEVKED